MRNSQNILKQTKLFGLVGKSCKLVAILILLRHGFKGILVHYLSKGIQ